MNLCSFTDDSTHNIACHTSVHPDVALPNRRKGVGVRRPLRWVDDSVVDLPAVVDGHGPRGLAWDGVPVGVDDGDADWIGGEKWLL